jgi:hypothetical protein
MRAVDEEQRLPPITVAQFKEGLCQKVLVVQLAATVGGTVFTLDSPGPFESDFEGNRSVRKKRHWDETLHKVDEKQVCRDGSKKIVS